LSRAVSLGLACSIARVVVLAGVVLTAFVRLDASEFIRFSQFHVGLSIASFIECLAAVERNRLYADGSRGEVERLSLNACARWIGPVLLIGGLILLLTQTSFVAAVVLGAGVATLSIPESVCLRERPGPAARNEFIALVFVGALIAASWFIHPLTDRLAILALAVAACAPRLSMLGVATGLKGQVRLGAAARCLVRARGKLVPFIAYQGALPWLLAVPNFVIPHLIASREASWLLLALRASGTVASMLQRVLVTRWIQLVDGTARSFPHGRLQSAVAALIMVTAASVAFAPIPQWISLCFAVTMACACAGLAVASTTMNARSRFLRQLPSYAVFWCLGPLLAWTTSALGRSVDLSGVVLLQSGGALLGLISLVFLSRPDEPQRTRHRSNLDL
jgi:hypothetical protein